MANPKMACQECDWQGLSDERLVVPNPYDNDSDIFVCPSCKVANCCRMACDEDYCWERVTCGTPTPKGYRQTCRAHRPVEGGE